MPYSRYAMALNPCEEKFDDYSYLLLYLIFDIYLRSKVAQINFLDQPAVEILKKNTRA